MSEVDDRGIDFVARSEGGTFYEVQARIFAERVRDLVQNLVVPEAGRITVSAGVSELTGDEDPAVALARADANLYRAKAGGRNRVEVDQTQVIG